LELVPIVKNITFRYVKFVEDTEDLLNVTKDVMKNMSVNPGISEDDFAATYNNIVKTTLSAQRNYVQFQCKKRAMGKIF